MTISEWVNITHRDYVNKCVGYLNVKRREEIITRQHQWLLFSAVNDFKKNPTTMQKWWPIDGDVVVKLKKPSDKKLKQIDGIFRNLGKKHG